MSWSDDKELSLRADVIGWKFLKKMCLRNLINMCKDFEKQN